MEKTRQVANLREMIHRMRQHELIATNRIEDLLYAAECMGRLAAGAELENYEKRRLNEMWKNSKDMLNQSIDDIIDLMQQNEKIKAIKKIRSLFGTGLKESKDMYEAVENFYGDTKKELLRQYKLYRR